MRKLKLITTTVIILSLLFCNTAFAFTYEEVEITDLIEPASEWAQPEINKAMDAGLLTPNTCIFFKSDITRSQFAELVVNMVEKVTLSEVTPALISTFKDTQDLNILKAYNAGIVNGVSSTEFDPDELITREQIASMIYRAISYIEKTEGSEFINKNDSISLCYTDSNKISSYATQAVGILANNNIMSGTSSTTISPKSSATIEQSVLLIYRLYNIVNK
jgi:hypothetical protein